jgi:hypothetical protein
MLSADTATRLTNSWSGIVPSHGYCSAKPWSSDTECTWNPAISLPVRATFVLERYASCVPGSRLRAPPRNLAAGIRRVKGVKKLGVRVGNWLTAEQGRALGQSPARAEFGANL